MTQPQPSTPAEPTADQTSWVLIGVSPAAEPRPEPVAPPEPFNPLAGLDLDEA